VTPADIAKLITEDPDSYGDLPDDDEFGHPMTLVISETLRATEVASNIKWMLRERDIEIGEIDVTRMPGEIQVKIEGVPGDQTVIDLIGDEMSKAGQSRISWNLD
jgi:hypothetical protein